MKRQPEGIPAGGQFASDRKHEPGTSLERPSPNAPAGLERFPGRWTPADEDGRQTYTSPGGTDLRIFTGNDPEVEYDAPVPEDAFQLYPRQGGQQMRKAINDALTDVAARKALSHLMKYSGTRYERMGLEAILDSDQDGPLLKSLHITVRDLHSNEFLEISHDYISHETAIADIRDGDLASHDSSIRQQEILSDLLIEQNKSTELQQNFFDVLHDEFDTQDEQFGAE